MLPHRCAHRRLWSGAGCVHVLDLRLKGLALLVSSMLTTLPSAAQAGDGVLRGQRARGQQPRLNT